MPKPDALMLDPGRYPVRFAIAPRFADLDANHHVNNVALASFFQEARINFDRLNGFHGAVTATGRSSVVVSVQIDYLAEAFYPDVIEVHVGTMAIGRSSWTVAALAVQGASVMSFMQATSVMTAAGRPCLLPQDFRDSLLRHSVAPVTAPA